MSLLLSQGHKDARLYPFAVVWSEARIIRQRESGRMQAEAVILQTAIASMFSKEGGKAFQDLLKKVDDVG